MGGRGNLTWSTIAAFIQPRIGGIRRPQSSRQAFNDRISDTSQAGVSMWMPSPLSSETTLNASDVPWPPERNGTMRYRAPLLASHLRTSRPMPPNPPATREDASGSHNQSRRSSSLFYTVILLAKSIQRFQTSRGIPGFYLRR